MIAVSRPGALTTVQDQGRPGHRASGMPLAGAVDRYALAAANALCGNPPEAAALEMTLVGGAFRFEREAYAAVCGADMGGELEGRPARPWTAFPVPAGASLSFGPAAAGCRAYLAVHGGIDVPPVLGSRSTYARARVGGLGGRALAAGDLVPVGRGAAAAPSAPRALPERLVPSRGGEVRLRVLPGPQDDHFAPDALATLFGSAYRVTAENDRMGYRLAGPAIRHARGADIVSDALGPGAIQVPGSGMPIVLMADCQTVGGYAKIGWVIGPDLAALAQARTGDLVRLARCSDAEAVEALRVEREALGAMAALYRGTPWSST